MYAATTPPFLSRIEKCNRLVSWRAWAPFSSLPFFFLLPLDLEHTSSLALKSSPSIFLLSVGGNVFYYCHFWAPTINVRFRVFVRCNFTLTRTSLALSLQNNSLPNTVSGIVTHRAAGQYIKDPKILPRLYITRAKASNMYVFMGQVCTCAAASGQMGKSNLTAHFCDDVAGDNATEREGAIKRPLRAAAPHPDRQQKAFDANARIISPVRDRTC